MTKVHLHKILQYAFETLLSDEFFNRLYDPEYLVEKIDESHLNAYGKRLLCFDYKSFNFEFVEANISCTGIEIRFKSNRIEKITVNVFFDPKTMSCGNLILATPKFTENDWIGRKSINQRGHVIRNSKSLKKYIEKIYSIFDCPILNELHE